MLQKSHFTDAANTVYIVNYFDPTVSELQFVFLFHSVLQALFLSHHPLIGPTCIFVENCKLAERLCLNRINTGSTTVQSHYLNITTTIPFNIS